MKEKNEQPNNEKLQTEEIQVSASIKRNLSGPSRKFAYVLGICTTLFVLYTALFGQQLPMIQCGIVLTSMLSLTFLWYPTTKKSSLEKASILDWILVALTFMCMFWTITNLDRFLTRIPFSYEVLLMDKVVGVLFVILILEAGRRSLGLFISITALGFILYAFFGQYFPGMLYYKGLSISKFVDQVYMTTEGMFGSLAGMASGLLYGFIAFGTMLQVAGADKYFMDICIAFAGKKPGGPAKVAVLSSAALGTISGSAVANVVTTGTLTIPLMKKAGYKPEEAGAIEACASTGGQIMPPIMGTGAFILADTVGIPYVKVLFISIIPAILYYASIYIQVHLKAMKKGLKGLNADEIPVLRDALRRGGIFFVPVLVLAILLVLKFTPFLSSIVCMFLILLFAQFRKATRINFKQFLLGLEACAISMTSIAGVIFCATLIVAMINVTGLMMKTTAVILSLSNGILWLAVILVAIMSWILGLGLPIATSYVILATLAAPALNSLGVDILSAHLAIFWFSQTATLTPPVCMAAFAAAAIAKAEPMKTGWISTVMGLPFYYIPIMFIYSSLATDNVLLQLGIGAVTLVGIFFLSFSMEGYFLTRISTPLRVVSFAVFALLFMSVLDKTPFITGIVYAAIALALAVILYLVQTRKKKNEFLTV